MSRRHIRGKWVQHIWNMMAHTQKSDLVFQQKGRVHLNWQGGQFSWLLAAEVCASVVVTVVMLGTPCSEVERKTTGYPLHSHVSSSLPLPCVTMCHQVSTELYSTKWTWDVSFMPQPLYTWEDNAQDSLNSRMGEPQGWCKHFGNEKISYPC